MHLYSTSLYQHSLKSTQIWHVLYEGSHQTPAIPAFIPQLQCTTGFGQYSLCVPTEGWPGWVDLGGRLNRDKFPALRVEPNAVSQSPVLVLTEPGVKQLHWCDQRHFQYAKPLSLSTHACSGQPICSNMVELYRSNICYIDLNLRNNMPGK